MTPLRRLFALIDSNWISTAGSNMTTLGFLGLVTSYVLNSTGSWTGPYTGLILLAWLGLFVCGLLTIPTGLILFRHELRIRPTVGKRKPVQVVAWLLALTLINFVVIGVAGSRSASHMSSVQFCGTACHQVMQPEYDAYFESPHSGVACVDCHVGPGATWYLKSKLTGARQAWMTLLGTWRAPIPTPVHGMREPKDTCGHCHATDRYVPDRLVVRHHFDEEGAMSSSVLMVHVGGQRSDEAGEGIHWHAQLGTEISYVATDEQRSEIPWVRVKRQDGSLRTFTIAGVEADAPPAGELRRMDCIDCHNRPSHRFQELDEALDQALTSGALDSSVPAIVPAAKAVLQAKHTREDAPRTIRTGLESFFSSSELVGMPSTEQMNAAAGTLSQIWLRNIFPGRGVDWGTYPSLDTHLGCLRCHDGDHADEAGEVISMDCDLCHTVLSMEETDPEILESLGIEVTR